MVTGDRERRRSGLPPGAPFLAGVAAFLACHGLLALAWERFLQPEAALETPWFLASKTGIVATQVALGLVALILALRAASWRNRFNEAGLMAAGVMAAVTALFFVLGPARLLVGPPELWPVALVSALLLLAPAILAGTLLGGYLARTTK